MFKTLCAIMLWSVIFVTHATTTVTEFTGNDNSAAFDTVLANAGFQFYSKYDVDNGGVYTGPTFGLTGLDSSGIGTSGTWDSNGVAIAGFVIKTSNKFLFINFGSNNTQTSGIWCTGSCTIDGVATTSWLEGKDLSHLSLYTAIAPVPEASTYALMLSGLGVVGFMVRRKKNKQV